MFLMPFFIISIFAIIIAYSFKEDLGKVLPSAIYIIPIILYITGLFGNLLYGIFAIYTICIIAIFYFIYLLFFQNKNEQNKYKLIQIKNIIISPSLIVFFILFILIYLYNKNTYFSNWDEWTHWGPFVKDMFFRNKFYNTKFHIAHTHLSYPPFKQLFEYFYCKMVFNLTEPNIYRAYQLLCFSLCFMIFSNIKFNENIKYNIKNISIIFLIVLYFIFINRIINFSSNPINSIYADAFLGFSFGFFMVNILQFDFNDKFKNFNLVMSEVALIFSKQMGGGGS